MGSRGGIGDGVRWRHVRCRRWWSNNVLAVLALGMLIASGCGPAKIVAEEQGVRVFGLSERFVPEETFVVTFRIKNLERIAKRVTLKVGISYFHPDKPFRSMVTETTVELKPAEQRTLSVDIIWGSSWAGPYADIDESRREPVVEILSVSNL